MSTQLIAPMNFLFGQTAIKGLLPNLALLLLRLYAGITMCGAGLDKVPTPPWMVEQVVSMNFPMPEFFAWLACFSEFAFGLTLVFGLMTRVSGFFLAFTMGVASFGFQHVGFLTEMHIAQHFFWIFVLFMIIGGGKYSLDYMLGRSNARVGSVGFALATLTALLAFSLYKEQAPKPEPELNAEETIINSINVPGSFNDWDPTANEMLNLQADQYALEVQFEKAGMVEFKFTANGDWDINLGEKDQAAARFPVQGVAELDQDNDTENIRVYIPKAGSYQFSVNKTDFSYSVDSVSSLP